jgi:hypothetical protein
MLDLLMKIIGYGMGKLVQIAIKYIIEKGCEK